MLRLVAFIDSVSDTLSSQYSPGKPSSLSSNASEALPVAMVDRYFLSAKFVRSLLHGAWCGQEKEICGYCHSKRQPINILPGVSASDCGYIANILDSVQDSLHKLVMREDVALPQSCGIVGTALAFHHVVNAETRLLVVLPRGSPTSGTV